MCKCIVPDLLKVTSCVYCFRLLEDCGMPVHLGLLMDDMGKFSWKIVRLHHNVKNSHCKSPDFPDQQSFITWYLASRTQVGLCGILVMLFVLACCKVACARIWTSIAQILSLASTWNQVPRVRCLLYTRQHRNLATSEVLDQSAFTKFTSAHQCASQRMETCLQDLQRRPYACRGR